MLKTKIFPILLVVTAVVAVIVWRVNVSSDVASVPDEKAHQVEAVSQERPAKSQAAPVERRAPSTESWTRSNDDDQRQPERAYRDPDVMEYGQPTAAPTYEEQQKRQIQIRQEPPKLTLQSRQLFLDSQSPKKYGDEESGNPAAFNRRKFEVRMIDPSLRFNKPTLLRRPPHVPGPHDPIVNMATNPFMIQTKE